MKKIVALLAALILTLSMMSIASAEPIKSTYNLSEVGFIDQVGWYWTRDLSLVLRDDTHYELFYREYVFGTTDPGLKGNKLIVYSGTYSSAESADDEACHFDITLNTLDGIYFEQHGKSFGRNVLGYAMVRFRRKIRIRRIGSYRPFSLSPMALTTALPTSSPTTTSPAP